MVFVHVWQPKAVAEFCKLVALKVAQSCLLKNLSFSLNILNKEFDRKLRLSGPTEFQGAFKGRCKLRTQSLSMFANPNGLSHPRLGINIAKKHIRSAVKRNSVKRIIRESFRAQKEKITGLDVVIVVSRALETQDKLLLRSLVDKQWLKLSMQCKKKLQNG